MTHESPHEKSADAVHEGRPVEAQYVRGGRGGVRILTLLIVSAAAAAVLLLGMWLVSHGGFASTNDNAVGTKAEAEVFDTAPTTDAPTPSTGQPAAKTVAGPPTVNAPAP